MQWDTTPTPLPLYPTDSRFPDVISDVPKMCLTHGLWCPLMSCNHNYALGQYAELCFEYRVFE